MTKDAENIGKTPATGFYGHDDVYSYLEDQKKLEETARQHRQATDMMDRLAEEEDARRKEQQKQSTEANSSEDTDQTEAKEADTDSGATPPPYNPLAQTLCRLYGTSYLSELYIGKLNDFSIVRVMPDKDDKDKLAMVAIARGNRVFELTETHVITESGIDPQAAYDLALHAKLNPALAEEGVSMLPGSNEDRVLLYFAAMAFGLKINNADELTEEQKASPPEEWLAFLASLKNHPQPEAEQQPQEEAKHEDTGYEASEPGTEPDMTQGVSMESQPVETSRYGNDYYNEAYPAPSATTYSYGYHDPEEAAKIPTLTDVVEDPPKGKGGESAAPTENAAESASPAEAKKAPVSEKIMTDLFNANIDKKTYMEAREMVIDGQNASRSTLKQAFDGITDRKAKTIQACLREENIIAKDGANKHKVLVQPS